MAREGLYTGIDLGTSKVVTLIASVRPDGGLLVHGMGEAASDGMQRGRVVDVELAQAAVGQSLNEAQRNLGRLSGWAYLGVSGEHIACINNTASRRVAARSALSREDIEGIITDAKPNIPPGKELLHHIPVDFSIDGLSGVRSPEGLEAETLEVRTHSVTGDSAPLDNARRAVEACKVEVRDLIVQSIAGGEAILSPDEQEVGVVLADIGEGTVDILIYRDGNPWYSSVIPVGGFQLTRDLSIALGGTPHALAERLKLEFGHAMPSALDPSEEVPIPAFFGKLPTVVSRKGMCEPLYERAREILELIMEKVRAAGLQEMPSGGLVLTGGSAGMPGFDELGRRMFRCPVRIGAPGGYSGLPAQLQQPAYSASVGILLWGIKHQGERRDGQGARRSQSDPGFMGRLLNLGRKR